MSRALARFLVALAAPALAAAQSVTFDSLLDEMTDLDALTTLPDPPFTCRQFSSYDRASKTPDDHDAWFANADAGQYLRVEERNGRKEYVMADVDGPGAIVRIWSANPDGTLRIYLDGAEKPVIETPMPDWLGGRHSGAPAPIACETSKGWNTYLPIPYARHCKITSDSGKFYYHVGYRTYPPGTAVQTFAAEDLVRSEPRVREIAAKLAAPAALGLDWLSGAGAGQVELSPGQEKPIAKLDDGPAAIRELALRVEAADLPAALRSVVLTGDFDGARTVQAPLGDLFGAAPGVNPYATIAMGMLPDGAMWMRWVMPYQQSAALALHNLGTSGAKVSYRLSSSPYDWSDRSLHFHAKWRGEFQVPTRPMRDWNYLDCKGAGNFVGVAFNIANPVKQWWGEGDEKIYVDGESFPSFFGTGTEDYYGYAWCWPVVFTHAYRAQPRVDGPGNYGHTSVVRVHVLDRIPFTRSFRFDMELWHWHDATKVDLAVTAYWYGRPGGSDTFAEIKPAMTRLTLLPKFVPWRAEGALEGESLKIVEQTARPEPQGVDGCSNEQHLWWHETPKPGDRLTLALPVERAGRYRVWVRCVAAPDYAIVRMHVNGKAAGEPVDFYAPRVVVREAQELGVFDLPAGESQLSVEIVGANEKAIRSYMFGLDYVRLEPVE